MIFIDIDQPVLDVKEHERCNEHFKDSLIQLVRNWDEIPIKKELFYVNAVIYSALYIRTTLKWTLGHGEFSTDPNLTRCVIATYIYGYILSADRRTKDS